MRLYLAGPMSGYEDHNFPAFNAAARLLRAANHDVVNPAELDENVGTDKPWSFYLRRDLGLLVTCEGIVLLPGWEESRGARLEAHVARELGLSLFLLDGNSLQSWDKAVADALSVEAQKLGLHREEVRVKDPTTGGEKGSKIAQLGAVDPLALLEVAKVAGFGGQKYERYNFAKGYSWSLSWDAKARHSLAFWAGEDTDPESGCPHLAHEAWHCLALLTFQLRGLGKDDRFPRETV